jgi:tetratricopeptide (TPR) repeat protein/predicted Ser/Thr protein kinase
VSVAEALRLFEQLVDSEAEEQQTLLAGASPEVATLVRGMLARDASTLFRTGRGQIVVAATDELSELPDELPGYVLGPLLGRGGMGRVYAAEQASPRREVALKVLHPWLTAGNGVALQLEAEAQAALIHPGIPQVYALEEHGDLRFLVMERVHGQPLHEWWKERGLRERVRSLCSIGEAVAFAHGRGFLHLDLKPGNILVTPEGRPKVLDFGLARTIDAGGDGHTGGTPRYMAPEQARGDAVDVRADVYALGVMLEEAAESASVADLDAVAARASASAADLRYGSVEAFVDDLRRWLDRRPVTARDAGPVHRLSLSLRRRPLVWGLGVLAVGSMLAGTASSMLRAREAQQAARRAEVAAEQSEAVATFLTETFLELDDRLTTGKTTLIDAAHAALVRLDEGALDVAPDQAAELRNMLAQAFIRQGEFERARQALDGNERLYASGRAVDDAWLDTLHLRAVLHRRHGERDLELQSIEQGLALAREHGRRSREALLLHAKANWSYMGGDYAAAHDTFVAAKRIIDEIGFTLEHTPTWVQLGYMKQTRGEYEAAAALFQQVDDLAATLGDKGLSRRAMAHHWLARVRLDDGDAAAALRHLEQTISLRDGLGLTGRSRSGEQQLRAEILLALERYDEASAALAAHLEGATEVIRLDALMQMQLWLHEGRIEEAEEMIGAAYARDADAAEGTEAWAWARLVRGTWRAHRRLEGAADDLKAALAVWGSLHGNDSPKAAACRAALALLEGEPP